MAGGDRRRAQRWGLRAETWAAIWLTLKGYRIVDRRFKTPVGEIDLIARRRSLIVFVEVKARATLDDARAAITPFQRRRILRAAEYWTARHPRASGCDFRFDAVFVARPLAIAHLKDAFGA